jgi:Tol biopolymer transport system component
VDGAVAQGLRQRVVDEAVLLEQRQAVEARSLDGHLKVVAAAGSVFDAQLGRVRECFLEERLQRFDGHAFMLAAARYAERVRKLHGVVLLFVVAFLASGLGSATASFPGRTGSIVFQRTVKKNTDIYSMTAAGRATRRLTKARAAEERPAWSPDGKQILFSRGGSATRYGSLWSMTSAGKRMRRVVAHGADPAWAPDGSHVAFVSHLDIFVSSVEGGSITNITRTVLSELEPAWSPDGTKIAFARSNDGESYNIYVANSDGTGLTQLTRGLQDDGAPNWSPDGRRIAFYRRVYPNYERANIWVINSDGTGAHRVTKSGRDYTPAWSPDGRRLVFSSYRHGRTGEIYVVNADGTGLRRLTRDRFNDWAPDWQPVR